MSLRTLVQLNLLLAAAPAFAGWVFLAPFGHLMLVRAACVPASAICREASPPISSAVVRRAVRQSPISTSRLPTFAPVSPLLTRSFPLPVSDVLLSRSAPFPHAARAP